MSTRPSGDFEPTLYRKLLVCGDLNLTICAASHRYLRNTDNHGNSQNHTNHSSDKCQPHPKEPASSSIREERLNPLLKIQGVSDVGNFAFPVNENHRVAPPDSVSIKRFASRTHNLCRVV